MEYCQTLHRSCSKTILSTIRKTLFFAFFFTMVKNAKRRTVRRRRATGTRRRSTRARRSVSRRRSLYRRRFFRTRRRRRSSIQRAYMNTQMREFRQFVDRFLAGQDFDALRQLYQQRFGGQAGIANVPADKQAKMVLFSMGNKYDLNGNAPVFERMMFLCSRLFDMRLHECILKIFRVDLGVVNHQEIMFKATKLCEKFCSRQPRVTRWKWRQWLAFFIGIYQFACSAQDRQRIQFGYNYVANNINFPMQMFTNRQITFLRTLYLRVCAVNNLPAPVFPA